LPADLLPLIPTGAQGIAVPWCAAGMAIAFHGKLHAGGNNGTIGPNFDMMMCQFHLLLWHLHTTAEGRVSSAFRNWQGKEAVKAEAYREALKQTPNGFYRRQLYVLEVNLRQQQAMWVDLHHSIFYEVRCVVGQRMVALLQSICHSTLLMCSIHHAVQTRCQHIVLHNLLPDASCNGQQSLRPGMHCTAAW